MPASCMVLSCRPSYQLDFPGIGLGNICLQARHLVSHLRKSRWGVALSAPYEVQSTLSKVTKF